MLGRFAAGTCSVLAVRPIVFIAVVAALLGAHSAAGEPQKKMTREQFEAVMQQIDSELERLQNLAEQHRDKGDHAGAARYCQEILQIKEQLLGPEHAAVGVALDNLATTYMLAGNLSAARPLMERSLAILEKSFGRSHPDVATVLNNLSIVLSDQGEHAKALAHCERSLAIDLKAFGENHRKVAQDVMNVATILERMGKKAAAKRQFERVVQICSRTTGSQALEQRARDRIAGLEKPTPRGAGGSKAGKKSKENARYNFESFQIGEGAQKPAAK